MKPVLPELAGLADALRQAAAAGDWSRLARLDQSLARYLARPEPVAERAVLLALREAYAEAMALCTARGNLLAQEMTRLSQTHEAQQAYAQFSDQDET